MGQNLEHAHMVEQLLHRPRRQVVAGIPLLAGRLKIKIKIICKLEKCCYNAFRLGWLAQLVRALR